MTASIQDPAGASRRGSAVSTARRRPGRGRDGDDDDDDNLPPPPDDHVDDAGRARSIKSYFSPGGNLRPFRLLRQDLASLSRRYMSDWTVFNQQVVASAVYIFFTNLLPGITFASDLYSLTGKSWGTIEIVFSTGLCGVIFSLCVVHPAPTPPPTRPSQRPY